MALEENDWKLAELVSMPREKRFKVEERWIEKVVSLGEDITMITMALGPGQFAEAFEVINVVAPQGHIMQVQATDDAIYVCFAFPMKWGKRLEKLIGPAMVRD